MLYILGFTESDCGQFWILTSCTEIKPALSSVEFKLSIEYWEWLQNQGEVKYFIVYNYLKLFTNTP